MNLQKLILASSFLILTCSKVMALGYTGVCSNPAGDISVSYWIGIVDGLTLAAEDQEIQKKIEDSPYPAIRIEFVKKNVISHTTDAIGQYEYLESEGNTLEIRKYDNIDDIDNKKNAKVLKVLENMNCSETINNHE